MNKNTKNYQLAFLRAFWLLLLIFSRCFCVISPFTQSCVVIASANAIFTFVLSLMAAPHLLLRDLKFLPRIDDR